MALLSLLTGSFEGAIGVNTQHSIKGTTITASGVTTLNGTLQANGALTVTGNLTIASGGQVIQVTNKSTPVTLNNRTGQIKTHDDALPPQTTVSFQVTNTTITATDVIITNVISTSTAPENAQDYIVTANRMTNGNFYISISNVSAAVLSDDIVIQFVAITGSI